jgi:hypothetical protein
MLLALKGLRAAVRIEAMLKQYGFDGAMAVEEAHEFRATIAPKSDDADAGH